MGNFLHAVKRGVSAALNGATGPWEFVAAGKVIRCPHCNNTHFKDGKAMLNSGTMTFMGMDWADPSATILACTECGRIEWFAVAPKRQQLHD